MNVYVGGGHVNKNYDEYAKILKALSDPNRLEIIDIISCGEKCACELLESFNFTQPTLSHHMKVLKECGLVLSRKEGLWNYYSLDLSKASYLVQFLRDVVSDTEDCICKCIGK
jgi:ArsR family transcriptional regulator